MIRNDPLAQRWLAGVECAHYRKRAGMTLSELSAASGIGRPKLGHMESGRYQQSPEDVRALMEACGASAEETERLVALASQSEGKSWWGQWRNVVAPWFRVYLGLEGFADSAFYFDPIVLPGLLQTPDYARAITRASIVVRPDHVDRLVELRTARAARLVGDDPLQIHAIIGEPALHLRAGTDDVQRVQMEHLLELARRPNITIQVLRLQDGPYAALSAGRFDFLRFKNASPVACAELLDDGIYVHDPDKIGTYTVVIKDLQRLAYSPEDSLGLIEEVAR